MDRYEAQDLAEMIDGYMEAALWSEAETIDVEDADEYPTWEIAEETRRQMRRDCAEFIVRAGSIDCDLCDSYGQVGHDFWLTRQGHGAGFWDRGLGDAGERLTDRAREFGHADIYRGDEGLIWQMGTEPSIVVSEERGQFVAHCGAGSMKPHRAAFAALFAVAILLALIGATGARSADTGGAQACFPASSWNANQDLRPCIYVGGVQEDGSARLYVGTVVTDEAVCIIPNVREERGQFVAHCRRLPR